MQTRNFTLKAPLFQGSLVAVIMFFDGMFDSKKNPVIYFYILLFIMGKGTSSEGEGNVFSNAAKSFKTCCTNWTFAQWGKLLHMPLHNITHLQPVFGVVSIVRVDGSGNLGVKIFVARLR